MTTFAAQLDRINGKKTIHISPIFIYFEFTNHFPVLSAHCIEYRESRAKEIDELIEDKKKIITMLL